MFNRNEIVVNNVPAYAKDNEFWTVREIDGEFWFWGAFNDIEKAVDVAMEIDGYVCR